ncbi:hypothetical protein TsFJ059_000140 [Trichoderma semiorbis]|uniref:Zn(2)-C6 fungal-type domain-containing protein n=1 Tax=Trichoderma semiorbis TaxID=1491008 RepID=A0A9P8HYS6_9HYPO|nr:hypothetical protein TsFJ059_000140 [Trichoderma semiorbis]
MPAVKRTSIACTTCRQVKLRCDAQQRFPAPCTRCEKQVKTCVFDPRFKRQVVRGTLQKVIEEKEELEKLIDSLKNGFRASDASPSINSKNTKTPEDIGIEVDDLQLAATPSSTTAVYELGGIHFGPLVINELLEHFYINYFYHVPFIISGKSADWIHQESELLFWTLLLISARNHPIHSQQFTRLKAALLKLLSEYLIRSIRNIYTVQSLLLLCAWPMPVMTQSDDPSWNYCNLAVSAVQQIGIRESLPPVGEISPESLVYFKTWLGCFVMSTELATDHGFPPPMTSVAGRLPSIKPHMQQYFSHEFWARCELQEYSIRVSTMMSGISPSQLQMSLLNLLERDLDSLGARVQNPLSQRYQIDFLAARLRLCAIPLLALKSREMERRSSTQERAVWYRGFHAAVQLASIYSSLRPHDTPPLTDESSSHGIRKLERATVYYPKHLFRVLCIAGMYLTKFLAMAQDIEPQERTLARNKIKEVYETFLSWSTEELDEPFRTARMIGLLSRHAEDKISSAYFSDTSGDPSPTIVDDGVKIASKIRECIAVVPSTRPINPTLQSLNTNIVASESHHRPSIPENSLSDWNDWLPNTYDDLLGFLGSPSNSFFDELWTQP